MEGRCTCGAVRYRLASPPLFTHCCHCRWCQRQTGSACVVNAMIETDRIQLLTGQPEMISIPSPSGMGLCQRVRRQDSVFKGIGAP